MNITNDKVTEYFNSYYEPLDEELAALRAESEQDNIPLILKETETYFRTFLKIARPKRILEIGTAYGYSAVFFAKLLPDCTVTTIELSDRNYYIAKDNVAKLGLQSRIQTLHDEGASGIEGLIEDCVDPYDMVFIDAAKSHYKDFMDLAEKICNPGAIIICDNILMKAYLVDSSLDKNRRHRTSVKRMHEFLDYLHDRKDLDVSLLSLGDGLAVIRLHD